MKKVTFYQCVIKLTNGKTRRNPLLPSEFHLIKSMLKDTDVESVEVFRMSDYEDKIVNYF